MQSIVVGGEGRRTKPHVLVRHAVVAHWRASRLPATMRGLLWATGAGFLFVLLNMLMRSMTLQLGPYQTQFLRYLFGLLVMLPLVARSGLPAWRPRSIRGQFSRGALHAFGLTLWFLAVSHITLADATAIGFTTPIFIMLGAALVFREPMRWERWAAALIGLAGVLVVVAPHLSGSAGLYSLLMLSTAPIFAASFLFTKALTRYESPGVIIVWQAIAVSLFSLPMALLHWQAPSATQWAIFLLCGLLGSASHYCLTRSYLVADISATQSVKFLDLVWATLLGWMVFGDAPSHYTIAGGLIISASTVWIARREARTAASR